MAQRLLITESTPCPVRYNQHPRARGIVLLLIYISVLLIPVLLSLVSLTQVSFPQRNAQENPVIWVWNSSYLRQIITFAILQALLSTAGSLILGLFIARSCQSCLQGRGQKLLIALLFLPMVLPVLVVIFGWIATLGNAGWLSQSLFGPSPPSLYGLDGILLVHIYLNAPFAALIFWQALQRIPAPLYQQKAILGLKGWQGFYYIEWPALGNSLYGIACLIFYLCFSSFAVVLILGATPRHTTLEVAIYQALRLEYHGAQAVMLTLTQIALALIFGLLLYRRKTDLSVQQTPLAYKAPRHPVYFYLHSLVIIMTVLVILLPVGSLFANIFTGALGNIRWQFFQSQIFLQALYTSLTLAFSTGVITLVTGYAIASALAQLHLQRQQHSRFTRALTSWLERSLYLLLVVPALALGSGFFIFGQRMGANEIMAPLAIILTNLLHSLPFILSLLLPGLIMIGRYDHRLIRLLGMNRWQAWRLVIYPRLAPALALSMALALNFSLGDFGVIALFGSNDFQTLPLLLHESMGQYRRQEAHLTAFVMVLLNLAIFTGCFWGKATRQQILQKT